MTRNNLLADLDTAFAELQQAMDGLTHQQKLQRWFGDWCVYDICSHIIGWHHEMDDALERIARGERPVPEGVDYSDADSWNARFIETWVQSSGEAVLQELETSKVLFVTAARLVPEDKFEDGRAAFRILHATAIDHYREHAKDIREWREREGV
ncbi:MAG: ClbS/DfsB family four-helix bundle protein [Dehalococcoidia bacterium]